MKTKRITESAMLLALSVILELVSKMFIPELPFGGQITLASTLPVILVSYRHGLKWGFVTALGYAAIEMMIGMKTISAAFLPGYFGDSAMVIKALTMCLLDYIVAYGMLGLGGIFRNRIKKPGMGLLWGCLVALGAKYLAHVLSGYILFSHYATWFFTQNGFPAWGNALADSLSPGLLGFVYSVVYNGMYMLPEAGITALLSAVIGKIPGTVKKIS